MWIRLLLLLAAVVATEPTRAQGSIGVPDTIDGYPTNVGFLIVGHSTSAQGTYPAKLVAALNDPSHVADGRHYVAFGAITGGDGGLLWSLVSVGATDTRYHRATASQTIGESPQPQWCEDATTVRWSCRRAKVEHLLTGAFPIPDSGTCADATVDTGCRQPASIACTWYDRTQPLAQNPVTQSLSPHDCWQRMDYRIALVQDTSNRSWPIDDYDASGTVNDADAWLAARIRARALPCPQGSGVIGNVVDWNCDATIDANDSAVATYAGWLRSLAADLLDTTRYGELAVDAVVVTQKPTEMGQCQLWPVAERPTCMANPHALRTPAQIAATPDRPLDHYYLPTVYWEYRAIETLFAAPDLDPRILPTSPSNARELWERSAACFANGLSASDWQIPAAVPNRPTLVAADDSEVDSGGGANSNGVGCMVMDHVHHNDGGGWLIADTWYRGLAAPLWSALPDLLLSDSFE